MHQLRAPQANAAIDYWIAAAIALVFSLVGFFSLPNYGLTIDELENLVVGERYLAYFNTGDASVLDMQREMPQYDRPDGLKLRLLDSNIHPPLPNILAALADRIFHDRLGVLDPVDARHMVIILMAAATLSATYLFAQEAFGRALAILAVVFLALYPRFYAHAHYNLKDIPKTLFFVLSLWTFWRGVVFQKPAAILLAGFFLGVGLSVRPNLILAAGVGFVWLLLVYRRVLAQRGLWLSILAVPLLAAAGFFLAWPALWIDPGGTLQTLWQYWTWVGISDRSTWTLYPWLILAFSMPLITLVALIVAAVASLRGWKSDRYHTLMLLWLWFLLPVARVAMPGMTIYDGIRHFLEVVPALSILAALGVAEIAWLISQFSRIKLSYALFAGSLLIALALYWQMGKFSPYEIAYFNPLVGGLSGAQAIGIQDATDYWGSSYRQGYAWLNQHLRPGEALYLPEGQQHLAQAVHGLWLDGKIPLVEDGEIAASPVYVMHITRPNVYTHIDRYCRKYLQPVYAIRVDHAEVLEIFYLTPEIWAQAVNSAS
jgi:4-amino-4-deoxy-L-arabinose transferase-like glycosyltransferase